MTIDSTIVGTKLAQSSFEVSWRHATNYAASIGDVNPRYLDDSRSEGLVAHPLFAVAVTWPVSQNIREHLDIDGFPWEVLTTQVHYSERLEFHRLVRPGEMLTIGGVVEAVLPHRAGTHFVIRYDVTDDQGRSVFTEHTGAMLRGVTCSDDGRALEGFPGKPVPRPAEECVWSTEVAVSKAEPFLYDGCADIAFPIHTSNAFARAVGLPGIILQGTATLAMAAREIINREADGDPHRLLGLDCRFTGMVLPGTTITLRAYESPTDSGCSELRFEVLDHNGDKAISRGTARLSDKSC